MEQTPNYDSFLKMSWEELQEATKDMSPEEKKAVAMRFNEESKKMDRYINSPEAREVMGRASKIVTGEPLD